MRRIKINTSLSLNDYQFQYASSIIINDGKLIGPSIVAVYIGSFETKQLIAAIDAENKVSFV
jgi:hypothetical protein